MKKNQIAVISLGDCRRPFSYLCDEGVEELKAVLRESEEKGLC